MTQREGVAVDQFRDHWAGQARGARLAWALSFADQPELQRVVTSYQRALQDLSCLDLVPMSALQLTLLDVGDAESVGAGQVDELIASARSSLGAVRALRLSFGAALAVPDGVVLRAEPVGGVDAVRAVLPGRAGAGSRMGAAGVAVAYANEVTTAAFVKATLGFVEPVTVTVTVAAVELVRFDGRYRSADWTGVGRIPLG